MSRPTRDKVGTGSRCSGPGRLVSRPSQETFSKRVQDSFSVLGGRHHVCPAGIERFHKIRSGIRPCDL